MDSTKIKLVRLALKGYLKSGAHNLSFQGLATELGVSQAAIYKHFKSKDELMLAAIRFAADEGQKLITEKMPELPALDLLKEQIRRNLSFCIEDRNNSVALLVMHYYSASNPEIRKLHEEMNARRKLRIFELLKRAQFEGKLKKLDLEWASDFIHSLLLGEMIKCFLWPKQKTITERTESLWLGISKLI